MILKMSSDKNLVITAPGNTFEDESNAEVIRVLLPKAINGTDIKDCTVWLNFVNADGRGEPIDLTKHLVEHSDTYYMAEIQMTRKLTDMPGESQFWIEITSASSDMLARTNKVSHLIKPHTNIADVLPEESLPVLYEILQKLDDLYNSGGIDPNELKKHIVSAVESYLIKNPVSITETDPTVPNWAKNPVKPTYTAGEVGTYTAEQIDAKMSDKANKSDIYAKGVIDSIRTKAESAYEAGTIANTGLQNKQNKTDDSLNTNNKTIVGAINEILDKYNIIPDWAKNQTKPTYGANEVGAYSRDEIDESLSLKADVYNTYTKDEVDLIISEIESGGSSYEETDPTVPDWAKQPDKPTYTAEEVGALSKIEGNALSDSVNALLANVSTNSIDIEGIRTQIAEESHFRGYISSTIKILALSATPNDFAYSAESGTKWIYDAIDGWTDTGVPVPDQLTPASNSNPLMDGVYSIGKENAYARGDHRHPTDETRASVQALGILEDELVGYVDRQMATIMNNMTDKINVAIGEALEGDY